MDIGDTNSIRMIQLSGNTEGLDVGPELHVPVDPKITKDDSETGKELGEIILGARERAGIKTKILRWFISEKRPLRRS